RHLRRRGVGGSFRTWRGSVGNAAGPLEFTSLSGTPYLARTSRSTKANPVVMASTVTRVTYERLNRGDVALRRDRQETVVRGEDGSQIDVGSWRKIRFVLTLAIGDDIVFLRTQWAPCRLVREDVFLHPAG